MEPTESPYLNFSSPTDLPFQFIFRVALNGEASIRYFGKNLFQKFFEQAMSLGIKTVNDLDGFEVIIDALFGFNYDINREKPDILNELYEKSSAKTTISIDVPSGWGCEELSEPFWKPDYILSLGLPKKSTKIFKGHHYLCCSIFYLHALKFFNIKIENVDFKSYWIKI